MAQGSARLRRQGQAGAVGLGAVLGILAATGCGQLIGLDELSSGGAAPAQPEEGGALPPEGYVHVNPGTFLMGSPENELGRSPDEVLHQVQLSHGFWLQADELTQGQWHAVTGKNPAHFQACGLSCPVEMISWYESVAFANSLSQRESLPSCYTSGGAPYTFELADAHVAPDWPEGVACKGYRLPTEAEWEYAARAGSADGFSSGPIVNQDCMEPALDRVGWYCGNSAVAYQGCEDASASGGPSCAGPHPAGQKEPNAWGMHDVHGNVWEWVWDGYAEYDGDAVDPIGPATSEYKVGRGGFWYGAARYCRAARRFTGSPGGRTNYLGVRIARTVP